jgi:predicted acylesterase/phospholipase RssA
VSTQEQEALQRIAELTARKDFARARRELLEACDGIPADLPKILRQKLVLCTYKDTELPAEDSLLEAWDILAEGGDPIASQDHETLSLAASISRRLWEVRHDLSLLRRARACYQRALGVATAQANTPLQWYSRIALASVLDLLADADGEDVEARDEARALREAIVADKAAYEDSLYGEAQDDGWDWWPAAAVAAAHFGLGQFDEARSVLERGIAAKRPQDWHRETVARDIATLGMVHGFQNEAKARAALAVLANGGGFEELSAGRMGLALSGGGLRAAFFHAGVLARLAECGLLRHVEVLSCVSGGSILGALYYLLLKQEFEAKDDLTDEDYDAVVSDLIARLRSAFLPQASPFAHGLDFLWRKSIRTQAFIRAGASLKTRTELAGDLMDEKLFAPAHPGSRSLCDLRIKPAGTENFHPARDNWRRRSKVPVLVINATTANTGHNWQFTASWMGEPPSCVEPAVDGTERLRRLYHEEAPEDLRRIPLKTAVAASAAVPGIFPPIRIHGLYEDRTVCLMDGGVHDNQGINGLMDQGCAVAIISDGCGQLRTQRRPSGWFFKVIGRANDILMDAGRRSNYRILVGMKKAYRLRALNFIHLKQGLRAPEVDWEYCERAAPRIATAATTGSPLNVRVQEALAAIRTDLDSFSKAEIDTLMLAGYLLAGSQLDAHPGPLPMNMRSVGWPFQAVVAKATNPEPPADYLDGLAAGRDKFGRLLHGIRKRLLSKD